MSFVLPQDKSQRRRGAWGEAVVSTDCKHLTTYCAMSNSAWLSAKLSFNWHFYLPSISTNHSSDILTNQPNIASALLLKVIQRTTSSAYQSSSHLLKIYLCLRPLPLCVSVASQNELLNGELPRQNMKLAIVISNTGTSKCVSIQHNNRAQ